MTWRSTTFDAPRIELLVNPSWLLAPLLARESLPTKWLTDWSTWWASAVRFRPGGPAPRQQDLVAFSPTLTEFWQAVTADFDAAGTSLDQLLAERIPAGPVRPVEQDLLDSFAARTGRTPAPRTLTVLVVPFGEDLFVRPEPNRLVVDADLRLAGERYRELLDPVLDDFF